MQKINENNLSTISSVYFPKIYIEVSNICNLQCTFCPEVLRDKKIMPPATFKNILERIKNHTKEITMHLMGEPLAHPQFKELYEIASDQKIPLQLTTNGLLLSRYEDLFLNNSTSLKQINFSIQSFLDNFPNKNPDNYLQSLVNFSQKITALNPNLFINFRLWNALETNLIPSESKSIIEFFENQFSVSLPQQLSITEKKSWRLTHKIRIHWDTRFEWPSLDSTNLSTDGYCHGLTQHIGILSDGTVVPCCLDKEAKINLGNVLETELSEIIYSNKAQKIISSFKKNKACEELCQKCTFKNRFN